MKIKNYFLIFLDIFLVEMLKKSKQKLTL